MAWQRRELAEGDEAANTDIARLEATEEGTHGGRPVVGGRGWTVEGGGLNESTLMRRRLSCSGSVGVDLGAGRQDGRVESRQTRRGRE